MIKTIITFIIVFGVLVSFHEFGHFFFAKRAGILVREFAIGMGPKIISHQAKDGTTYTLRLLPIGGYVRMAGLEEEEVELKPGTPLSVELDAQGVVQKINASNNKVQLTNAIPMQLASHDLVDALTISGYVNGNEEEVTTYQVDHDATIIEPDGLAVRIAPRDVQFQSAKLWQRILTNFAGPMNNFILALFLCIVMTFMQGGVPNYNSTQLGTVASDSAASAAGLKANDTIKSIDGTKVSDWDDMTAIIQKNPNKKLQVVYTRAGSTKTASVTPKAVTSNGEKVGQFGVTTSMKTSLSDKITGGFSQMATMSTALFKALGNLITGFSLNKLGGPVAMFQMSSEAASQGLTTVVYLMALLSVNLGVVNLIPLPGLDGGKILLNIIEGIRRKPLSPEKEGIITMVGFGLIMILMVLVTWNDISRYFLK